MIYVCEKSFIGSVRGFFVLIGDEGHLSGGRRGGDVFHKVAEGHMGGERRGICLSLGR